MSDFSATPLDKLVKKLGDNDRNIRRHLQRFELERKTTDFNAVKTIYKHTPLCVDETRLADMLNKHEDPTQPLFIDLYHRINFTVANNLTESGFQTGSTARFQLVKQQLRSVKFTINLANLKRWDAYTTDPAEKWQMEYDYLFVEAVRSLLQGLNNQVVTYFDSIKAPAGGVGTRFAAAGDFKVIPANLASTMYRRMRTEARENRFGRTARPTVLGSLVMAETLEDINSFGPNNNQNLREQLDWFDPMDTDAMAVPDVATDDALLYMIDGGGVGAASWVYDFNVPASYQMSNETWRTLNIPQGIVDGLPTIQIGYKDTLRKTDNFATFNIEEARINREFTAMIWTNLVLFRAYSSVPTESPVIAYVLKK